MFNKKQSEAILSKSRFTFLVAGAGTGKTRTLIGRIERLVSEGVKPEEILAITFTKKAASEMKERLDMKEVRIETFHAFFYQELKKRNPQLQMTDFSEQFSEKEKRQISDDKRRGRVTSLLVRYQRHLDEKKTVDFDDLEIMFLKNVKSFKNGYRYILIDEFQDTSHRQYEIVKQIVGPKTSLFVVGDPDQSIYSFRGSELKILKSFLVDFNPRVIVMEENYRSSSGIIELANEFIKKNSNRLEKELIATRGIPGTIELVSKKDFQSKCLFIKKTVSELLSRGVRYKEMAFLFRRNFEKTKYSNHFIQNSIYGNSLNFMTVHEAKGLEFDAVIIVDVDNRVFPSQKAKLSREMSEERRLMYVAITRARDYLCLISTSQKASKFYTEIRKKIKKMI